jgi:hypothetical protein
MKIWWTVLLGAAGLSAACGPGIEDPSAASASGGMDAGADSGGGLDPQKPWSCSLPPGSCGTVGMFGDGSIIPPTPVDEGVAAAHCILTKLRDAEVGSYVYSVQHDSYHDEKGEVFVLRTAASC